MRLNAVDASVKDVREVIEQAQTNKQLYGTKTILFLDEVHRFNSSRQDAAGARGREGHHYFHRGDNREPFSLCKWSLNEPFYSVPA